MNVNELFSGDMSYPLTTNYYGVKRKEDEQNKIIGGVAKGHPDENDLANARIFAMKLI